MPSKLELMAEAYRRGILPPEKKALYEEALRRGLVPGAAAQPEKPRDTSIVGRLADYGRYQTGGGGNRDLGIGLGQLLATPMRAAELGDDGFQLRPILEGSGAATARFGPAVGGLVGLSGLVGETANQVARGVRDGNIPTGRAVGKGLEAARSLGDSLAARMERERPQAERDALAGPIWGDGAPNLAGLASAGYQSIPSTAALMGVSGGVGALTGMGARGVGAMSAVSEGLQSGVQAAVNTREQVRAQAKANPEAFLASPMGRRAMKEAGGDINKAIELAAMWQAHQVEGPTGVTTGLLGMLGGNFTGKALTGGLGTGFRRNIVEGAVQEGLLEEGLQSATEQLISNITAQSGTDPSRGTLQGVPEAYATGATLGALMGGAAGGVATIPGKLESRRTAKLEQKANELGADIKAKSDRLTPLYDDAVQRFGPKPPPPTPKGPDPLLLSAPQRGMDIPPLDEATIARAQAVDERAKVEPILTGMANAERQALIQERIGQEPATPFKGEPGYTYDQVQPEDLGPVDIGRAAQKLGPEGLWVRAPTPTVNAWSESPLVESQQPLINSLEYFSKEGWQPLSRLTEPKPPLPPVAKPDPNLVAEPDTFTPEDYSAVMRTAKADGLVTHADFSEPHMIDAMKAGVKRGELKEIAEGVYGAAGQIGFDSRGASRPKGPSPFDPAVEPGVARRGDRPETPTPTPIRQNTKEDLPDIVGPSQFLIKPVGVTPVTDGKNRISVPDRAAFDAAKQKAQAETSALLEERGRLEALNIKHQDDPSLPQGQRNARTKRRADIAAQIKDIDGKLAAAPTGRGSWAVVEKRGNVEVAVNSFDTKKEAEDFLKSKRVENPKPHVEPKSEARQLSDLFNRLAARMKGMLGSHDVRLIVAAYYKHKDGEIVEGYYDDANKVIMLARELGGKTEAEQMAHLIGVLNHEVLHALKALGLITEPEWKMLVREAKRRKWVENGTPRSYTFYERASVENVGQPEWLMEEEAVAEMMRVFGTNPKAHPQYAKILDRIIGFLRKLTGFTNEADRYMARILEGEIGRREEGSAEKGRGSAVDKMYSKAVKIVDRMKNNTNWQQFLEGQYRGLVEPDGSPKIMFHGTLRKGVAPPGKWTNHEDPLSPGFDFFKVGREMGAHFGTHRHANDRVGGLDFATAELNEVTPLSSKLAEKGDMADAHIYPVVLAIKNPVRITDVGDFFADTVATQLLKANLLPDAEWGRLIDAKAETMKAPRLKDILRAKGHCGIVYLIRIEATRKRIVDEDTITTEMFGVKTFDKYAVDDAIFKHFYPKAEDSYIAFAPEQVKSIFNPAPTNDPRIMFSKTKRSDIFTSPLEVAVLGASIKKAPAPQWKGVLKNAPGVKADELDWTGVMDWLDVQEGPVTKEAVLAWVKENGLRMEEYTLSNDRLDDFDPLEYGRGEDGESLGRNGTNDTKFGQWKLPGGEDYREIVFRLPNEGAQGIGRPGNFRGSHFDSLVSDDREMDNIFAHIRITIRNTPDGKRVLFVDEIQSDLHQRGRTEGYSGVVDQARVKEAEKKLADAEGTYEKISEKLIAKLQQPASRYRFNQALKQAQEMYAVAREARRKHDAWIVRSLDAPADEQVEEPDHLDTVRGSQAEKLYGYMEALESLAYFVNGEPTTALHLGQPIDFAIRAWNYEPQRFLGHVGVPVLSFYSTDPSSSQFNYEDVRDANNLKFRVEEAVRALDAAKRPGGIPNFPFKGDKWAALVMKRIIQIAVDEEADAVAWIKASQYNGGNFSDERGGWFYERNLPNIANDIIKRYGGKVGEVFVVNEGLNGTSGDEIMRYLEIPTEERNDFWANLSWEERQRLTEEGLARANAPLAQPGFYITPALAEAAENPNSTVRVYSATKRSTPDPTDPAQSAGASSLGPKPSGLTPEGQEAARALAFKNTQRVLARQTMVADFLSRGMFWWPKKKRLEFVDRFAQTWQDRYFPIRRMINDLRIQGHTIDDAIDVALEIDLLPGSTGHTLKAVSEAMYLPAMKAVAEIKNAKSILNKVEAASSFAANMADWKGTDAQKLVYLLAYAEHAPERNWFVKHTRERTVVVEKDDPNNPGQKIKVTEPMENGSGMTNEEAKQIIDAISSAPNYQQIYDATKMMRAIVADTVARRIRAGLSPDYAAMRAGLEKELATITGVLGQGSLTESEIKALQERADKIAHKIKLIPNYKFYVPLRGRRDTILDDDTDVGFSTDDMKSGGGYGMKVAGLEDKRAKGRMSYADDVFASIILQSTESIIRAHKNKVGQTLGELIRTHPEATKEWARILKPEEKIKKDVIDPKSGRVVKRLADERTPDSLIYVFKENGQEVRVEITNEGVAKSLMATQVASEAISGQIVKQLARVTRMMSKMATAWNVDFIVSNPIRDVQTAALQSQQYDYGASALILKDFPGTLAGIVGRNPQTLAELDELRALGGTTGYWGTATHAEALNEITRQIKLMEPGMPTEKVVEMAMKTGGWAFNMLEAAAAATEEATRLAVFRAFKKRGYSPKRAAQLAKTLTLDFNRGGTAAQELSAFYMFANVSIQGTNTFLQYLLSPRGATALAGIVMLGLWQEAGNGDDEAYRNIPEYIKERNLIFMVPGMTEAMSGGRFTGDGYIKIPIAWGFNVPHQIGRQMTRAWRGDIGVGDAAGKIGTTMLSAFNPVGTADPLMAPVPTVLRPFAEIGFNRNFTGSNIRPHNAGGKAESQNYTQYASDGSVAVTDFLHNTFGGYGEYLPAWGPMEINPHNIDHLFGAYLGGMGRTAARLASLSAHLLDPEGQAAKGRELRLGDIPVARVFTGNTADQSIVQSYQETTERYLSIYKNMQKAEENEDPQAYTDFIGRYGNEVPLAEEIADIERERIKLSRERREIQNDQSMDDAEKVALVKALKLEERGLMQEAMRRVRMSQRPGLRL